MRKINLLLLLSALLIASCAKKDAGPQNGKTVNTDSKLNSLTRFEYKPSVFSMSYPKSDQQVLINKRKQNSVSFLYDTPWSNGLGKTSVYESTDLPAILPETRRQIYLGAIIKGDQAINVEDVRPLNIPVKDRNPITIYANFPTDSISVTGLPSIPLQAKYLRDALKAGSGTQIQSFTYQMTQFKRISELQKSFGVNFNIGKIFNVNYLDTTSFAHYQTVVNAEIVQENFALNIEPPIYGPFLKNTVDMSQFGGVQPLIVSSITYGRKGILIMESDSTFESVRKTLSVSFTLAANLFGGSDTTGFFSKYSATLGLHLTKAQKDIIQNSKTYVYIIGADGSTVVQAVVGGLEGFAKAIAGGGGFSASNPGVPLYYNLNYLNDFGTFRHQFRIDYPNH